MSSDRASRNPFKGMRRFPDDGWIGGVCAGIAAHFDWSVRFVRVVAVLLLLFTNWPALLSYLILWFVLEPAQGPAQATGPAPGGTPGGPAPGGGTEDLGGVRQRFARLEERLRQIEACVTDREYELRRELRKLEG